MTTGDVFKARRMESEAAARELMEIRIGLPDAFVAIVARFGPILIESWIEGRPLNELSPSESLIGQAGALLATLHARSSAAGRSLPFRAHPGELKTDTLSGLQLLAASGALDERSARQLGAAFEHAAPQDVPHCLIHTDYCGENLVVDSSGRLFVVDNERFRIGPAAMDLARSRYRWGWYERDAPAWPWKRFLEAYEAAGGEGSDPLHEPFWRIAAVVASARVRFHTGDPGLATPVNCLEEMTRTMALGGGPPA